MHELKFLPAVAVALAAVVSRGTPVASIEVTGGRNLVSNGAFAENADGWEVWQGGFDAEASVDGVGGCLRLERTAEQSDPSSACLLVTPEKPLTAPFAFGCRVKADNLPPGTVAGPRWLTYACQLYLAYADGGGEYVQTAKTPTSDGSGWEAVSVVVTPKRPVQAVRFYAHLRITGEMRIDDVWGVEFPAERMNWNGCSVKESGGLIVLENDYVRCALEPSAGGTCREFVVKATGQNYAGAGPNQARMFADKFRTGGICWNRGYKAEILRNDPNGASVRLTVADPDGLRFICLSKTFSIKPRSAALDCVYSYYNHPDSMAELIVEPHFRLGWSARGVKTQQIALPTSNGVRTLRPKDGDCYITNAVAGWVAAKTGNGSGLVCEFDFAHVAREYGWLGGQDDVTSEWIFQPTAIAAGKTFDTPQTLYPFAGFDRVDSAENGVVSSIASDSGGMVTVGFSASTAYCLDVEVLFEWKIGETRSLVRKVRLSPDATVFLHTGVRKGNGLKSVRVVLRENGQVIHEALRMSDPGYVHQPRVVRAKPAEVKVSSLDLSLEVETPHVTWARPFAGGRPRVFFLTDYLHGREVVELMQRFDVDARAVRIAENWGVLVWGSTDRFGTYTYEESNLAMNKELARPLDAIVIASDLWKHVEEQNRTRIRKICGDGVGLVVIGDRSLLPDGLAEDVSGTAYVKSGMDSQLLIGGADRVQAFARPAGGRVVYFDYPAYGSLTPFIPYTDEEPPFRYQDYSLGVVAKAIAWVAKMDVSVPEGVERIEEIVPVEPGFDIRHVFFRGKRGTYDWRCEAVRSMTDGQIASISAAASGLVVSGAVKLVTDGERNLNVELTDGSERVIARSMFRLGPGDARFEIAAPENPNGIFRLTATLLGADGRPAARKTLTILSPIRKAIDDNYPVSLSKSCDQHHARRYLWPFRAQRYRELGVTDLREWDYVDNGMPTLALAYGFGCDFPVTSTHLWSFNSEFFDPYAKTKDRKYLCRRPCFNDPAFREKDRMDVIARAKRFAKYSPLSMDYGDEGCLAQGTTAFDFCFGEHTLKAEREWLKREYGTLERLNATWKTSFDDWAAVTPLIEEEALKLHEKDRQWAAWSDHRRFMELTYCGYFADVRRQVHEVIPGLPMDMSGTRPPNGWSGYDFYLLSRVWDVASAYTHENQCEIIRSFGRPLVRPWHGYGRAGPDQYREVWLEAFRFGNCGVSWFDDTNILEPDHTISKKILALREMVADLTAGGGMMLKRTVEEQAQALVHYSHRSIHAAQIEKRNEAFLASRDAWCRALEDAFVRYRFVSTDQIEEGELSRTTARVLVLPVSAALSDAEAAAIRAFAANGGLVVYDETPGVLDGHCNLRPSSAVSDLLSGGRGVWRPDCELLRRYTMLRLSIGGRRDAWRFRNALLAALSPFLSVDEVSFATEDMNGVRTFSYRGATNRQARYVGLVAEVENNGGDGVTEVRMAEPRHVYNMRRKTYLGRQTSVKVELSPCEAAFLALLPYEIEGLSLDMPRTVNSGDLVSVGIAVSARGGTAALHPVKVEVYDSSGRLVYPYSRVVATDCGRGLHEFRLALNDRPGVWRIESTEFVTGKKAVANFEVKGGVDR